MQPSLTFEVAAARIDEMRRVADRERVARSLHDENRRPSTLARLTRRLLGHRSGRRVREARPAAPVRPLPARPEADPAERRAQAAPSAMQQPRAAPPTQRQAGQRAAHDVHPAPRLAGTGAVPNRSAESFPGSARRLASRSEVLSGAPGAGPIAPEPPRAAGPAPRLELEQRAAVDTALYLLGEPTTTITR